MSRARRAMNWKIRKKNLFWIYSSALYSISITWARSNIFHIYTVGSTETWTKCSNETFFMMTSSFFSCYTIEPRSARKNKILKRQHRNTTCKCIFQLLQLTLFSFFLQNNNVSEYAIFSCIIFFYLRRWFFLFSFFYLPQKKHSLLCLFFLWVIRYARISKRQLDKNAKWENENLKASNVETENWRNCMHIIEFCTWIVFSAIVKTSSLIFVTLIFAMNHCSCVWVFVSVFTNILAERKWLKCNKHSGCMYVASKSAFFHYSVT